MKEKSILKREREREREREHFWHMQKRTVGVCPCFG